MNPFREFFKSAVNVIPEQVGVNMEAPEQIETERKPEEKVIGKIIKVSEDGWGFIIAQEIPFTRIFFHWTSLVHDTKRFPDLKRGMHAEFVPVDKGERGYHAIKVRIIEENEKEN